MKPFDHNKFIGYICEVTPQYVRMQIPSARLLHSFYFNGEIYFGVVDLLEVLLLLKVRNMDFLAEFLSKVFLKVKERK